MLRYSFTNTYIYIPKWTKLRREIGKFNKFIMKKILIIEDDIFFQKFYQTKLLEKGYEIEVASDGEEGLSKIAAVKPDLILLDLIMPKKDGFDVLKTLAERKEKNKTPILVFSTLSGDEDINEAMKLGAQGYINKGITDFDNSFAKISSLIK